jgi:ABC-type sugar transport system permease subunit
MFQTGQVGSAAALGIVLMLIIFAVTYGINRVMERGTSAT